MSELREKLGIDEWLELVKEDKNLDSAYTSFAQYMYILEQENQELKEQNIAMETTINAMLKEIKQLKEQLVATNKGLQKVVIKRKKLKNKYQKNKQQIKQKDEVIDELENHCELMLRIFEKMDEQQRDKELDKFKIYDYFLRIIKKSRR